MHESPHQESPTPSPLPAAIFPGGRTSTSADFARALAEAAPQLSASTWESLFQQTGGRDLAGLAVLRAASTLGHDLSVVENDRFPDLISTDILDQIREQTKDHPELRLAHLLSFVDSIGTESIAIAAHAMPYLGSFAVPAGHDDSQFDTAELTARLVEEGLLIPQLVGPGRYEMPAVLRAILRRVYDGRNRHSESRSRRALGAAAAESLRSPRAYRSNSFDEALSLIAHSGQWAHLAEIWARYGHGLILDHFDATISAFTSIPEPQRQKSAVLAEALADCHHVADAARRLGTDDPRRVLSEVTFDHAGVPALSSRIERTSGVVTISDVHDADEVLTMAIAEMRELRHLGHADQAQLTARTALDLIADTRTFPRGASRLLEARFHIEHAISTLFIGDIAGSHHRLRRAMTIMELTTGPSPYLLLPANAFSALAHAILGNGTSSDAHLREFERLSGDAGFRSPTSATALRLTRMIRAMDSLDVDAALDHANQLADPSLGHHTWVGFVLYRAQLGILRRDLGVEDKRIQQIIETNHSLLPDGGYLLDRLRHSLVCLHLAKGHTHFAQNVLLDVDSDSPYIILARARLNMAVGENSVAANLANRVLTHKGIDLRSKAAARTLQAACLLAESRPVESDSAFVDALDYCTATASLIPLALVPKSLRDELIHRSAQSNGWGQLAAVIAGSGDSAEQRAGELADGDRLTGESLRERLLAFGETLVAGTDHALLAPGQRSLLALLDAQASVTQIADRLNLAEGTVKNKLSSLYSQLGVRNRRDALARGYEFGYLPAQS